MCVWWRKFEAILGILPRNIQFQLQLFRSVRKIDNRWLNALKLLLKSNFCYAQRYSSEHLTVIESHEYSTDLPSHFTPWRKMPYKSEPQWSQNVGDMYVYGRNRWGRSILNLSLKYWNGKWKCYELTELRLSSTKSYHCAFRIKTWFGTCSKQFIVTLFMDGCLTRWKIKNRKITASKLLSIG